MSGRRRNVRPLQGGLGSRASQGGFEMKQEAWHGQHRKVLGKLIKVAGQQKALIGEEVRIRVHEQAYTRSSSGVGSADPRMRVRYITLASQFDSCAQTPWYFQWHEVGASGG